MKQKILIKFLTSEHISNEESYALFYKKTQPKFSLLTASKSKISKIKKMKEKNTKYWQNSSLYKQRDECLLTWCSPCQWISCKKVASQGGNPKKS